MDSLGILCVFMIGWGIGALTIILILGLILWVWGTKEVDSEKIADHSLHTTHVLDSGQEADTERVGLGAGLANTVMDEKKSREHVPDVASGYFAVCREYVPGGINGKPPKRTTPTGSAVVTESPSVYQTMYRSIFDRNKPISPSLDSLQGRNKKARNVFYVVLRLGHLMLYDDSEQLEVRHVISLAHHDVDLYAGGASIPEGELWIKRNCIRLIQRAPSGVISASNPFFLFSDNCSEKEDFYHAMLRSQERNADDYPPPPPPLKFETPDLVRLVQQLHATEDNLHTRWINALIGRLFLAVYKTEDVERSIWTRITKKIARVPKPALISGISVQKINMGSLPPFITNPKLKDLTLDGDLIIEADVTYRGDFCLEISALARIELGSRFKAREVNLVLATILKKLEGHILLRIKPPPSNRMWITFETAPRMEMSLEPIVSSRQITYGVILRAIESRIREVVNETLVLPNWDDIPFASTVAQQFRGGLWQNVNTSETLSDLNNHYQADNSPVELPGHHSNAPVFDGSDNLSIASLSSMSASKSTDTLSARKSNLLGPHRSADDLGISSSTNYSSVTKPSAMRANSFVSVPSPILNTNPAVFKQDDHLRQQDATASTKTRIPSSSPLSPAAPSGPPIHSSTQDDIGSISNTFFDVEVDTEDPEGAYVSGRAISWSSKIPNEVQDTAHDELSYALSSQMKVDEESAVSAPESKVEPSSRHSSINSSLNSATATARKWISSRQNRQSSSSTDTFGHDSNIPSQGPRENLPVDLQAQCISPSLPRTERAQHLGPIGRGQPLPPPGTPLPLPLKTEKRTWSVPSASTFANLTRRKPTTKQASIPVSNEHDNYKVLSPSPSHLYSSFSEPRKETRPRHLRDGTDTASPFNAIDKDTPPPLPKRRQRLSVTESSNPQADQDVLVVEAPENSAPTSPTIPDYNFGINETHQKRMDKQGEDLGK